MLLRLFKTALEEEVMKKVDKISDIVSGNPMVIKMIVGFYKSGSGQVALRHSIRFMFRVLGIYNFDLVMVRMNVI